MHCADSGRPMIEFFSDFECNRQRQLCAAAVTSCEAITTITLAADSTNQRDQPVVASTIDIALWVDEHVSAIKFFRPFGLY